MIWNDLYTYNFKSYIYIYTFYIYYQITPFDIDTITSRQIPYESVTLHLMTSTNTAGTWLCNDVGLSLMRRDYVPSTSVRRHCDFIYRWRRVVWSLPIVYKNITVNYSLCAYFMEPDRNICVFSRSMFDTQRLYLCKTVNTAYMYFQAQRFRDRTSKTFALIQIE